MDTFKQVLAFPMYLTAVWLLWVLAKQRGADAIGLVLVGAVLLALGLWWWTSASWRERTLRRVLAAGLVLASLWPLVMVQRMPRARARRGGRGRRGGLLGRRAGRSCAATAAWCS